MFLQRSFGLIVVTLMLFRGINILRNRKIEDGKLVTSSSETKSQDEGGEVGFQDMLMPKAATLATRRGTQGLSISLNIGNYVVPSRVSTPTGQGPIMLHESTYKSTFSNAATPDGEYFHDKTEAYPGYKRRSSLTFADELHLSPLSHVIQIPTLSLIQASPLMQQPEQLETDPSVHSNPV